MTPIKRKKIKKIIIITSISVVSFYLSGGVLASYIVNDFIYKGVTTNIDMLEEFPNTVFKTRNDYPLLNNRIEHTFKSGKNKLSGYYYDVNDEKGLVISAHGINNLSDGSNAQMHNYFVSLGYDVFAIDLTGSGKSEGKSTIGLFQSAIDIKNAYKYLEENNLLKDNLILMGHSWGAYGSALASTMGVKANKVINFSAFDKPIDLMFDMAKDKTGFLADFTYPTFIIGNYLQYGDKVFKKASKEIKDNKTKYLIIQGKKDDLVPYKDTLYKNTLGFNNVTSLYLEDIGHDYPWLDITSINYINSLDKNIKREDVDLEKSSKLSPLIDESIRSFLN